MSKVLDARAAVTTPLTTIFTPPASCSSHWTYEAAFYNSIRNGLLIQNAFREAPDSDCFPSGWQGYGRAPSVTQVFSPGACPGGYTTAANSYNGAVTTAICCPSDYSYIVTFSSINYFSSSAQFVGCLSNYPAASGPTTVVGRNINTNLNTTTVTGPLTMWAQPFSVAFKSADLTLFTTTTSGATTSNTATPSQTSSGVPQTSSPSGTSSANLNSPNSSSNSSMGLSGGAIAGIVIGAAAVLGLIIGLALFFILRKRKVAKKEADVSTAVAASEKDPSASGAWSGNQHYNSVPQYEPQQEPQEMPTLGYGKSIRRAEAPANPVSHELSGGRDAVEMG